MALLNKLFSLKTQNKGFSSNHPPYKSQFPFDDSQVRVLLYKECDRGRRLLFDSSAIEQITVTEKKIDEKPTSNKIHGTRVKDTNSNSQHSNGFGYKHNRPQSSDISNIGEMVFGALAMSFRGTSLKVHWLQSPSRMLCSQVFLSPAHAFGFVQQNSMSSSSALISENSIETTSISSLSMPFSVCVNDGAGEGRILTHPLDVPGGDLSSVDNGRIYSTYSTGDSGYSGTDYWTTSNSSYCQYSTRSSIGSVFSDQDSLRKLSVDSMSQFGDIPSSDGGFQRRISRNISTSFENRNSNNDFIGFISDQYQTTTNGGSEGCVIRTRRYSDVNGTHSNPEIRRRGASGEGALSATGHSRPNAKRPKLGMAVCITMSSPFEREMAQFCSEHIALLESMLYRLRASVEDAYINKKNFLQIMFIAWKGAVRWISDLLTAPRLPCPVWMSLSSPGYANSKSLTENFMNELCLLLSQADTKDTNFFISTMLTAVLTHHLGWVSTVAAFNAKSKSQTTEIINEQKARLNEISRRHPYNALWAQLGDLYGAVGSPPKIARTVVHGAEQRQIEKVLHVLTYFIRCGEVRRASKSEVFDKNIIEDALNGNAEKKNEVPNVKLGLKRTQTCNKNLSQVDMSEDLPADISETLKKHVMNDIPNVLAYRDSRFVKQELRIGNYLMDTGIEMNPKQKSELKIYQHKDKIQMMLTTPDNIEIPVESSSESQSIMSVSPVEEGIEISPFLTNANNGKKTALTKLLGKVDIKEGLSWNDLDNLQRRDSIQDEDFLKIGGDRKKKTSFLKRSASLFVKADKVHFIENDEKCQTSLSDLITANNVGQSNERFTWGIEPIKETISLEEERHFELSKQKVEREQNSRSPNNVVFVLGDNETLVNIRKSTDSLVQNDVIPSPSNTTNTSVLKCTCNQHKKHSGVKFNFEQYPQIATNYMKNKNLDLTNYDFVEKSSKLEGIFSTEATTSTFPTSKFATKTETQTTSQEQECEYCARRGGRMLQTPSNATELEFETNDNYSTGSITLSTNPEGVRDDLTKTNGVSNVGKNDSSDGKLKSSNDLKIIPVLNIEKEKSDLDLIQIPIPATEDDSEKDPELLVKSGFIPSLFTGVSDHYISDMVLQGTLATPETWEHDLKQELSLSAHCSSLIAAPTENVAVIADLGKWDVRVVTSQTCSLPYNGNSAVRPVGMSQLVSTMLETVHAMRKSGVSPYECMSYIESKLQEMYLQSEALAAFLLATDFCSMNTITSALNLSANDVPLLLSVASIHTPQVTKKYGISFR